MPLYYFEYYLTNIIPLNTNDHRKIIYSNEITDFHLLIFLVTCFSISENCLDICFDDGNSPRAIIISDKKELKTIKL